MRGFKEHENFTGGNLFALTNQLSQTDPSGLHSRQIKVTRREVRLIEGVKITMPDKKQEQLIIRAHTSKHLVQFFLHLLGVRITQDDLMIFRHSIKGPEGFIEQIGIQSRSGQG